MLGLPNFTEFMASLRLVVVAERMAVEAIGNAFVVEKIAEAISTSLAWVERVQSD